MKKLLSSVAVLGVAAMIASPAQAAEESALKLDLAGHMKGYVTYVDQDEVAGTDARSVDILRETEIHFTGETTLDNGLTVGAHIETDVDAGEDSTVDESYAYFSGSWGRVNFGEEDGAAYLLQVAAPSADSNIDGIRAFVQPFNTTILGQTFGDDSDGLDYDNDLTVDADKLTYLTPVFNGFQLGASYTPDTQDLASRDETFDSSNFGVNTDDVDGEYGEAYEAAVRYEGMFNNVGFVLGGGYTTVVVEGDEAAGQDDLDEWNLGADFDIGAFGVGAAYTQSNGGVDDDGDIDTWVVGADYTVGPYKIGASYLDVSDEDFDGAGTEGDVDRVAGGVVYSYAPGMTFRGSIQHTNVDLDGADEVDGTAVLLGTQINF
jgi:outer membrane protein OmpU